MNPALPGGASTVDDELDSSRWSIASRVGYAFVPYGRLEQGRHEAPNPNGLAIDVHLATVQLSISAPTGTSLDLQLPFGSLVTRMLDERSTSTGLGDLETRVRQSFARWLDGPVVLGGALGIVAPTGPYVARSGAANVPPEASYLTLGRGTTWWLAEVDGRARAGAVRMFAQLSARGPLARTGDDFAWGPELRATLSTQIVVASRVSAVAATDLQWRGGASEPDPFGEGRLDSANAGGWQWALSPAIAVSVVDGMSIVLGARIPVISDVHGNQLVPEVGAFAAVSYSRAVSPPKRRTTLPGERFQPPPGRITVVDYSATWCAPCAEIARALAAARPRWPDVDIVEIDATKWPGEGAPVLPAGSDGLPVVEVFDAAGSPHAVLRGPEALRVVEEVDRLRGSASN